ncbi:MAG TPA: prenyltransferase/squalene oxidase repeat-containing protein [Pirellulales bacterium]|jgi:squalene-hopene/tetraprenyl-beta-curcumene cyclase
MLLVIGRDRLVRHCLLATIACAAFTLTARADDKATTKSYDESVKKALAYLTKSQGGDGSFSPQTGPAVTAIVGAAALRNGATTKDPLVAKALKYVEGFVHDDGGIYKDGSRNRNYETCVAVLLFSEANADGKYADLLKKADAFLKKGIWDESEGVKPDSITYGGAGYGQAERPDLSNTAFLIDALHASGTSADDESMQRALVFISRCQNLPGPHNTTPLADKNPDGGFFYTPALGGQSPAGKTDNGGLRSYGSMTYAGLKSMIYCGVNESDPRVKAAAKWAKEHYTLAENPGMADAGLYYYYQVFAKGLSTMKLKEVTDADGKSHDWRAELISALAERQQPDGSWVNKNPRWMENEANLVTAYALLALSYAKP